MAAPILEGIVRRQGDPGEVNVRPRRITAMLPTSRYVPGPESDAIPATLSDLDGASCVR
jgi:hypothetical protein